MTRLVQRGLRVLVDEGAVSVALKVGNHARGWIDATKAIVKLRAAQTTTVEDAIDLAFSFSSGSVSIKPWQFRSEILGLLNLLEKEQPRTVLEIGTCSGGTLFLFSRVAADDATLITVDLPRGRFGGGYPPWLGPLFRSFAHDGQRIELVRGNSHGAETIAEVKRLCRGATIDFLFIDGDHTYDGVKSDFAHYSPLVRPGGLVAFHDIVIGDEAQVGGVPTFWREIKDHYETREIVADWLQGSAGIGVILIHPADVNRGAQKAAFSTVTS